MTTEQTLTTEKEEMLATQEILEEGTVSEEVSGTEDAIVLDPAETAKKLEISLMRYFQNKEIVKERNDENKYLKEEIEEYFSRLEDDLIIFQLPSGEYVSVRNSIHQKEVLDRDLLANALQIDKKEMKTPFDFSMLTKQGKLEPKTISEFTETHTEVRTKMSKTKNKPKEKKERSE